MAGSALGFREELGGALAPYLGRDGCEQDTRRRHRRSHCLRRWSGLSRRRPGLGPVARRSSFNNPGISRTRGAAARSTPCRPSRGQHPGIRRRRTMRRRTRRPGERDRPPPHPGSRGAGSPRTARGAQPGVRRLAGGGAAHCLPILAPEAREFSLAARQDALDQSAGLQRPRARSRRATGSSRVPRLRAWPISSHESATPGGRVARRQYRLARGGSRSTGRLARDRGSDSCPGPRLLRLSG
jgi:hypothetical protein